MSNKIQLQTNNTNLASYTDRVDALIEVANRLPEAGGVTLPDLTSPAAADEIFLNKQTIDEDGNVLTGTFTIDSELANQNNLISQIETALAGKANPSLPSLSNPAIASEILSGKEVIGKDGGKITGTMPFQGAQTIMPSNEDQIIESGQYLAGTQVIKGDANLVADNIKSGVSIFDVDGRYEGSGSAETCTVIFNDIGSYSPILGIVATLFNNGCYETYVINSSFDDSSELTEFVLENVVCGTKIYLTARLYQVNERGVYIDIDGSAIYESHMIYRSNQDEVLLTFTAPSVTNENCTIYYAYNE